MTFLGGHFQQFTAAFHVLFRAIAFKILMGHVLLIFGRKFLLGGLEVLPAGNSKPDNGNEGSD